MKNKSISIVSVGLDDHQKAIIHGMLNIIAKTKALAIDYCNKTAREAQSRIDTGDKFDILMVDLDRQDNRYLWYTMHALSEENTALVAVSEQPENTQAPLALSKPFELRQLMNLIEGFVSKTAR